MKKINPNQYYLVMAATGYLIDALEEHIKGTSLYNRELKQTGNRFLSQLEKEESKIINMDSDQEEKEAMDQMSDSYKYFERWLNHIRPNPMSQ